MEIFIKFLSISLRPYNTLYKTGKKAVIIPTAIMVLSPNPIVIINNGAQDIPGIDIKKEDISSKKNMLLKLLIKIAIVKPNT